MGSTKDNPSKLILEGTLASEPNHLLLDRSLVSGSTAPRGSKKLIRAEDQTLFKSSEPGVKAEIALPPENNIVKLRRK